VGEAIGLHSLSPSLGQRWQEHASQDGNNGYDNQQFNQCKCVGATRALVSNHKSFLRQGWFVKNGNAFIIPEKDSSMTGTAPRIKLIQSLSESHWQENQANPYGPVRIITGYTQTISLLAGRS